MSRAWVLTISAAITLAAPLSAQVPQFRWEAGKTLTYRVNQVTTAIDTKGEKSQETTTRLNLVKKWKISSVDANGIATLTMTLDRLRMETKTPNGETTLFDSADPSKGNPTLRDEMSKFVGAPVLVISMNNRGQVIEIKECKFGPPSRLEIDLPFKIVLPSAPLAVGQAWDRKFAIRIEPVQGQTPEQTTYDATQNIECKSVNASTAVFAIKTTVTNPPESPVDQIPLLPLQPAGEVTFDLTTGRMTKVNYQFAREIKGQQGEESKYHFSNTYVEELVK